MDPEPLLLQEQSDPGPHFLSNRLQIFQQSQNIQLSVICTLRVNTFEFSVYTYG